MTDNMQIWDQVSKTDPTYTKKVNQRGGFTAIAAHSQIMEATRQFGPIGIGWGYDTSDTYQMGDFIVVPVTIWHGDRSNTFGPVLGCAEMFGKRPDSDAPKKATTDAITKGLSQLGFNADVFLGRFDDNKYIEQRAKEEAEKSEQTPEQEAKAIQEKAENFKTGILLDINNAPDLATIKMIGAHPKYASDLSELHAMSEVAASEVSKRLEERKKQLNPQQKVA